MVVQVRCLCLCHWLSQAPFLAANQPSTFLDAVLGQSNAVLLSRESSASNLTPEYVDTFTEGGALVNPVGRPRLQVLHPTFFVRNAIIGPCSLPSGAATSVSLSSAPMSFPYVGRARPSK